MFEAIHHITYLVWDLTTVEAYFQRHFRLAPAHREASSPGKLGNISYQIGSAVLRFSEPGRAASMEYDQLRRYGSPVVSHIALAVPDLAIRLQELKRSGVDFTQSELAVSSHGGYKLIDIAPEDSFGMRSRSEHFNFDKLSPDANVGVRLQLCETLSKDEDRGNA